MAIAVDLVILVLIAGMTWALMSEGLWGAALMFFNVLFAGVITFNFYEPLADLIAKNVPASVVPGVDVATMTLMFLITLVILRLITENAAPTMVRFPPIVYHIGRVVFGLAGATLVVSIMLLAYHLSPVHKKMFGSVDHDTKPPFGLGLDRRFLALMQYSSGYPFARYGNPSPDPAKEFGDAYVFDRQGRWLIDHEDARPFGEGWREEAGSSGAGGSGGAGSGLYEASGNAPTIPGGTAGAAAGLAPSGGF